MGGDYFRLVRMDASDIPHVATEPHPEGCTRRNHREISHLLALVFRNEGTKFSFVARTCKLGSRCVAADHPHDAALVLYRTDRPLIFADTISERCVRKCGGSFDIDMKYRTLDLQFVLDRLLELSEDKEDPLYNTMDDTRIARLDLVRWCREWNACTVG